MNDPLLWLFLGLCLVSGCIVEIIARSPKKADATFTFIGYTIVATLMTVAMLVLMKMVVEAL